ncbi:hypothetical protein [Saccharicrinis sp. FJH54]|uniref:hypothetical protein n=1 Tax=Saccharicrinis sp. FJH54 TaxID=3344665 RepID=UPI0035D440A1
MLQKADKNVLQFSSAVRGFWIYMVYKPKAVPWAKVLFAFQAKYFPYPNKNLCPNTLPGNDRREGLGRAVNRELTGLSGARVGHEILISTRYKSRQERSSIFLLLCAALDLHGL